jgi:hypothetical protein
VLKFWEIFR